MFSELNLLKLPGGASAGNMERMMVAHQWGSEYFRRRIMVKPFNLGHPTAPVDENICKEEERYWEDNGDIERAIQAELKTIQNLTNEELTTKTYQDFPSITKSLLPNLSGPPYSLDTTSRKRAAEGCEKFYDLSLPGYEKILNIGLENIIFTQGGAGGLNSIFTIMNKLDRTGHVVLQIPYYPLYVGHEHSNKLLTYHVIESTSDSGEDSNSQKTSFSDAVKKAKKNNLKINTAIFCTPNNPSGKGISEAEWKEIITVSKDENFYMVFDEAYAELDFSEKPLLLEFINQKLADIDPMLPTEEQTKIKNTYLNILKRSIILRSATKGCSASGERLAVMLVFDPEMIKMLTAENKEIGLPPYAAQKAYAEILYHWNPRRIDEKIEFLSDFYKTQVRYVEREFKKMGIAIADSNNGSGVDGTFYVIGNFNSMIGFTITDPEIQKKLQEIGLNGKVLKTDEDILYYFLVTTGLLLTPLSYFGEKPTAGKLRLVCSGGKAALDKALSKIKKVLEMVKHEEDNRPMTPATPVPPNLENNTSNIQSLPLLPRENFARRMQMYWSEKRNKSHDAMQIREAIFDIFKNLIKPYFTYAIHKVLHQFLNFPAPTNRKSFSPILLETLTEKSIEFRNIIHEMLRYLQKSHPKIFETLSSSCHISKDNESINFNPDLIETLEIYINKYQKSLNKQSHSNTMEVDALSALTSQFSELRINHEEIDLLSSLVFEKIFYNNIIAPTDSQENPFANIFTTFYHLHKEDVDFSIIDKISAKRASISYGHPQGDIANRITMAKTLTQWYNISIQPDEILFVTIRPKALLERTFGNMTILPNDPSRMLPELILENSPSTNTEQGKLILQRNFSEMLGISLKSETLEKKVQVIKTILQADPERLLAIDETYIERCLTEAVLLGTDSLVNHLPEFRDRIILIRSAKGIFTSEAESISILVTFNQEIMAKLLSTSINMHVHAPRSYQEAYTNSFHDFVNGIQMDEQYRKEWFQNLAIINKFRYNIVKQLYSNTQKAQETAMRTDSSNIEQGKISAIPSPPPPSVYADQITDKIPPKYRPLLQQSLLNQYKNQLTKNRTVPTPPAHTSKRRKSSSHILSPEVIQNLHDKYFPTPYTNSSDNSNNLPTTVEAEQANAERTIRKRKSASQTPVSCSLENETATDDTGTSRTLTFSLIQSSCKSSSNLPPIRRLVRIRVK